MNIMTWEDLKDMIKDFSEEQLKQTVTVYIQGVDEWYGLTVEDLRVTDDTIDVLDPGHKYLII